MGFRQETQRHKGTKKSGIKNVANEAIRQRRITATEVDVLILTMLRNARTLLRDNGWRASGEQDWLQTILSEYKAQVFVDEAPDFSLIQLPAHSNWRTRDCDHGLPVGTLTRESHRTELHRNPISRQ
jgi:hypothetical protein